MWKLLAFAGVVLVPRRRLAVANYHTFDGVHQVEACTRCHVMRPMVNDMHDPHSDTLAARHFRNRWIPQDQCFHCHSDYGLCGDLEAKMTGFRHLARYTTRTYHEPIDGPRPLQQRELPEVPRGMPQFEAVASHQTVRVLLDSKRDELPELPRPGAPDARAAHAGLGRLRPPDGGGAMSELRWEAWAAILAFVISLVISGSRPLSDGGVHVHRPAAVCVALVGYAVKRSAAI